MRKRNHIGNWIFCSANALPFIRPIRRLNFLKRSRLSMRYAWDLHSRLRSLLKYFYNCDLSCGWYGEVSTIVLDIPDLADP